LPVKIIVLMNCFRCGQNRLFADRLGGSVGRIRCSAEATKM
ncbi:hypothetical protein AAKU61_004462, partial [Undibacterium sp. GrIS 1.2]